MKSGITVFLVLVFVQTSIGQIVCEGDTLTYGVIENKPLKTILAAGINVDINGNNFQSPLLLAGGLNLLFSAPNFEMNLHSRIDLEKSEYADGYAYSVYEPIRSRQAGFNFSYKFHTDENTRPIQLGLYDCNRKLKIVKVSGLKPIQWGVDFGFEGGLTQYTFRNDYSFNAIDSNNQTFLMEPYQPDLASEVSNVGTKYIYSFLRFGLSRTRINHISVEVEQVGLRQKRKARQFYTHLFVLTSGKLDDIYLPEDRAYPNSGPYTRVSLNSVGFYQFGGCIGMNAMTFRKRGTNALVVEMGLMPGPKVAVLNSAYLNVKLRCNINLVYRTAPHYK